MKYLQDDLILKLTRRLKLLYKDKIVYCCPQENGNFMYQYLSDSFIHDFITDYFEIVDSYIEQGLNMDTINIVTKEVFTAEFYKFLQPYHPDFGQL